ncbi:MAG: DUF2804 domain-containing protein [Bacilli bacterium]|nr:DUF2804 domain-containing protein [Bacilli bacterium]
MQHLLSPGPLLDGFGELTEAGYAFQLVKKYDRKAIKGCKLRIKEWDYYYFGNAEYGIALTIDDNSYMSLASISFLDFKNKTETTKSMMGFMSKGKLNLPSTSKEGDLVYIGKKFSMKFLNLGEKRHLICLMKEFRGQEDFSCDILVSENNKDTMVIATPFRKKHHFYYNQKINNLSAEGFFRLGDKEFSLDGTQGVLDWGRGVWTYKNTWRWSSLSAKYNDHLIGWNLGYGFGDTSAASENMFFYDGKGYKLNDVSFNIPVDSKGKDDFMKDWTFTSKDGSIYMTFHPLLDRHADTELLIIGSNQHQVFGLFSGKFRVEGQTIEFKDLMGFAEKVSNKW